MNRLIIALVGTSIFAFLLAIAAGSWLLFQTWEEGKRLERINRELTVSLEASRIRLENYCDYPSGALCAEVKNRNIAGSITAPSGNDMTPSEEKAPIASSGESLLPVESSPEQTPAAENNTAGVPQTAALESPTPAKASPMEVSGSLQKELPPLISEASLPKTASTPVLEKALMPAHKKEEAVPAPSEKAAAPSAAKAESPSAPAAPAQKTWISLEQSDHDIIMRITGAGTSLTAKGSLLSDPMRYEVTLNGMWKVYNRKPANRLIKEMSVSSHEGNTVLSFALLKTPKKCWVKQEGPRTIAIIIR